MTPTPAGIVLAAGAGTRLRPLTDLRPKALCPVGGRPLVDLALDRLSPLTGSGPDRLAVNAHHHADQLRAHFSREQVHLEVETGPALGTAGAIGGLLSWLDGRPALVTNADSYLPEGLGCFIEGWDGERCRLLCQVSTARPDFIDDDGTGVRYLGACLLPWDRIRQLAATPSGLYEVLWRAEAEAGALDLVRVPSSRVAIDCGTPADYLAANLHASDGQNVIGAGATVLGRLERSVVWDGAWVEPQESLVRQVRAGDRLHPVTVST